jgi:hypothetical protein
MPEILLIQSGSAWLGPGEKIPVDTETEVDADTGEVISERSITGMDGQALEALRSSTFDELRADDVTTTFEDLGDTTFEDLGDTTFDDLEEVNHGG